MSRWGVVLPELALAPALLVAFAAVLWGGPNAGRAARTAWLAGAAAALAAALRTHAAADDFLFGAYRVDAFTQFAKALVVAGSLVAAFAGRAEDAAFGAARATGPFLRLAAPTSLVAAASAADLVVLWLLVELATVAHLIAAATEGRWATHAHAVRRLVAAWLPTAAVFALGVVMVGARHGTTRFAELEGVAAGVGPPLVLIAVLARAGLAPWRAAAALREVGEPVAMPVFAGASWWTLAVAIAIRLAALNSSAPADWAAPALVALVAVPAGLAALATLRGPGTGSRGAVVPLLVAAGLVVAAVPWAREAAAALP